MGRPELFLHAGTQKTGTTGIQQALAANRSWLDTQGVLYPLYFPTHHRRFYAHNQMARAFDYPSALTKMPAVLTDSLHRAAEAAFAELGDGQPRYS